MGALKAGLDMISGHLSLALWPFALDAFLWMGPRLSVKSIFAALYAEMTLFYNASGLPADDLKQVEEVWLEFFRRFNLLGSLRTFPLGVSSLMQGRMPVETPFGAPAMIEVGSWLSFLGWLTLITLLGWTLGAVYFRGVSRLVAPGESAFPISRTIGQSLIFSAGFLVASLVVGMPALAILSLLNLFGASAMQVGMFVMMLVASWAVAPFFFMPHGIFMRGEGALRSALSSLRMSRFALPSASLFVLALFLAAQGLNILWNVPADDSWMLLVGMAGHAFVTTALLAASFIYYRDVQVWMNQVAERWNTNAPRPL
ncbi:MAG: hypothetical protein HFACDABA_00025 [Anaerolineales bacterium]|nr:hypothetical protein [Anaerolineales bacterium]